MATILTADIIKDFAVFFLERFNQYEDLNMKIFPDLTVKHETQTEVGGTVRVKIPRIIPKMQTWHPLTDRPMEDVLPPFTHNIEIEKKGIGSEFYEKDLINDILGTKGKLQAYAEQAKAYIPQRAMEMIGTGSATTYGTCFDGKALFANDHSYGSQALDNYMAGVDLDTDGLAVALSHFNTMKDEKGEVMGIKPTYLMYHPALSKAALTTLNATMISNTSNIFQNALIPVMNPYFTNVKDWAVIASRKPNTAVLCYIQKEFKQNPQVDDITGMFMRECVKYGATVEYGLGYLDFRLALGLQTT